MSPSFWLVNQNLPTIEETDHWAFVRGEIVAVLSYGKPVGFSGAAHPDIAVLDETFVAIPGDALDPIEGRWRMEPNCSYFILAERGDALTGDMVSLVSVGGEPETTDWTLQPILSDLGLGLADLNARFRQKENDPHAPGDLVLCYDKAGKWSFANDCDESAERRAA